MAKILFVDDDHQMAELYIAVLKAANYTVDLIIDGAEAIQKARINNYQAILLDVMIPHMSGLEVLKALRSYPETQHVPIIMLSNYANETYVKQAMTDGANDYLVKTDYDPDQFLMRMNELLRSAEQSAQTAQQDSNAPAPTNGAGAAMDPLNQSASLTNTEPPSQG